MKRTAAFLLALCLALSLAVPAAAAVPAAEEGPLDAALAAVTLRVKDILEIGDDYARFTSDRNDGLNPGWFLSWSDEGRELSVTCGEDGSIREVYRWENTGVRSFFYGFDAAFPSLTEENARAQAEAWLARLLGVGETARIDGHAVSLTAEGDHRFFGKILLNGLESPISFELRLGSAGLLSFSRSDGYTGFVGGIPSAKAAVRSADAAKALEQSVALELYYIAQDGEARLQYVPVGPTTVVDALSGETVDMDALYASFGSSPTRGFEAPAAAEAAMVMEDSGRGLTEAELSTVTSYADTLSREALDRAVRSYGDLGLGDFELARCSYAMDGDGNITASLRYTCEMTADNLFGFSMTAFWEFLDWGGTPMAAKTVTVDAKTGELLSVTTGYDLWERDETAGTAAGNAEGFLRACAPALYEQSALCTLAGYAGREGQTFARVYDGYFFPENYLYVRLNDATGAVDEFTRVWDEDMVFAPSEGIVDETAAKAAYIGALDLTLGYTAWPEGIDRDDPVLYRYMDYGYTFVESLRLAYWYGGTDEVRGVDALTGEALTSPADGSLVYGDLSGVPEREAVEALGAAGIGFEGGAFRPSAQLTMTDAAVLLLGAAGYDVRGWDADQLRSEAVRQGFFPAEDWEPDRAITRMELLRAILGASAYGPSAGLTGVWQSGFSDVGAADAGFAAIARALGMADGTRLDPDRICTRAEGAKLLYSFMTR